MTAAAVIEAIARIERNPFDRNFRAPDPEDVYSFLDLSVPGIVIRCLFVDEGAAFEVLSIRRYVRG